MNILLEIITRFSVNQFLIGMLFTYMTLLIFVGFPSPSVLTENLSLVEISHFLQLNSLKKLKV